MKDPSTAFRELADVLDTVDAATQSDGMEIVPKTLDTQEDSCGLDFSLRIPFLANGAADDGAEIIPKTVELTDDGALEVTVHARVHTDTSTTNEQSTKRASCRSSASDRSERTSKPSPDQTETSATEKPTTSVPPYRKPDRLREVYEKYDSFAEMTDALDVEVTPQTVRRYMIQYDIHTPRSRTDTPKSPDAETQTSKPANQRDTRAQSSENKTPVSPRADGGAPVQHQPTTTTVQRSPEQTATTTATPDREAANGQANHETPCATAQPNQATGSQPADVPSRDHTNTRQRHDRISPSGATTLEDQVITAINRQL